MRFTFYTHFNGMVVREGLEKTADWAAEHGFSAVEVLESAGPKYPSLFPDRKAAEAAGKTLAERGLNVACYSVGTTVYKNPEAVASLKRQAEIAAALGCPYLHHTLKTGLRMAENAPAEELFAQPRQAYTQKLLSAVPTVPRGAL